MGSRPASLKLYGAFTRLLEPVLPLILKQRLKAGKEDPARLNERLGRDLGPRPDGPVVWLHGASVGETLSLLPLVERLRERRPDITPLVTSGTVTSAELLARRLPPGALHRYLPFDAPGPSGLFLDHWRPSLVLFVESEFWPNLLLGAKDRGAKLALVSARMTDRSAAGWTRQPAAAKAILGAFDLVLPQDVATADRLRNLGARIDGQANLKLVGAPLDHDPAQLAALKAAAGPRRIVLAASTHPYEEGLIAAAIDRTHADPLQVIVPRHPVRGPAVAADLRAAGRRVAQRSTGEPLTAETDVYVADTLGELGLFFRLADLVVMGGSFMTGIGGHNPLEPARLGKGVLHGRDIGNWTEVHAALGPAAILCPDEDALTLEADRLLADPAALDAFNGSAAAVASGQDAALDAVWARLEPLLP